jgi:ABC-type multidrug transport system fused ATPase/permease subunit
MLTGYRWLDTNPMSRVLTRCSQDMAAIDSKISSLLNSTALLAGRIVVNAVTAVIVAGWQMTAPAVGTVLSGLWLGHVYMTAQLPLKRLMSNAKSPIIGHIQNALISLGSLICLLQEYTTLSLRPLLQYP